MLEVNGNAWDLLVEFDGLCITTNGFIKKNGSCVMGAGVAKEAVARCKGIEFRLGKRIKDSGNNVYQLGKYQDKAILSFPVKHNWFENADIDLIVKSCHQLNELIERRGYERVLLPRPGCGNGKLKWNDVKPVIEKILTDKVWVVTF